MNPTRMLCNHVGLMLIASVGEKPSKQQERNFPLSGIILISFGHFEFEKYFFPWCLNHKQYQKYNLIFMFSVLLPSRIWGIHSWSHKTVILFPLHSPLLINSFIFHLSALECWLACPLSHILSAGFREFFFCLPFFYFCVIIFPPVF